jgi:hypothetical protein
MFSTILQSLLIGALTAHSIVGFGHRQHLARRSPARDPGNREKGDLGDYEITLQLFDFRDVTDIELSSGDLRAMADVSPFRAGSKRAAVTASKVAYGLASMYEILRSASPDEVVVFRDIDAALDWLRVADARTELLSALREAPPLGQVQ